MQPYTNYTVVSRKEIAVPMNKVLRNTYLLLSSTILWSAATAGLALAYHVAPPGIIMTIIGMFGLMFLTQTLRNSKWGIVAVFAFTGFMGYMLSPILSFYLAHFTNGGAIITTALGGTGIIFLSLSAYTLISKKDFSYLGGMLFAGITVVFIVSLVSLFFGTPLLQAIISGAFILLCSGLILFHTSQIIRGGETNCISATVSLYVALFNIFVSLLNILGFFAGSRR